MHSRKSANSRGLSINLRHAESNTKMTGRPETFEKKATLRNAFDAGLGRKKGKKYQ